MKIIFCMPGKTYSREFLLAWSDLLMRATTSGHQCMISQQYSSVVHFARARCLGGDVMNGIDQKPFQGKVEYDAVMWIDSDMVFKPDDFFKLLESPHDVTAGIYMMEDLEHLAVVKDWDTEYFTKKGTFKFLSPPDLEKEPQYIPVSYSGMGWMLIRKGVLEDLKYPWFWSPLEHVGDLVDMNSEDVSLCKSMIDAGHQVYIDKTIRVGHQKYMVI